MKTQEVQFKSNDNQLRGTILYPNSVSSNNPSIIFVHGWTSKEDGYIGRAKHLVDLGYICFTFNMSGHGSSEGNIKKLSGQDHLNDLINAYIFILKQDNVNPRRISLIGKSYGGYLSAIASAKLLLEKLVLTAPALYPDSSFIKPTYELIEGNPEIYRQSDLDKSNSNALESFWKFSNEKMLIVCEKDEEVPRPTTDCYQQVAKDQDNFNYSVIKNSDHTFSNEEWNSDFVQELVKFFK